MADYNLEKIRAQFKALDQQVNGQPLTYLDTAATALKPEIVVRQMSDFYLNEASNVHRGAHYLSHHATVKFENAREKIKSFLNASSSEEIIFTKGTTEGINFICSTYGESYLKPGDEVLLTELEHHANLVPWQNLAQKKNLVLKFVPVLGDGSLDEIALDALVTEKTRIIAFSGCSNTMGTFLPIEKIVTLAKKVGAVTVLDAAQLVSQKKIDVQKMEIDFLVFSAHKLFGPFGFGVIYGRKKILETIPPYQFGGSMISSVQFERSEYNVLPYKFEAGTPAIAEAIATGTAIDFFTDLNLDAVSAHEKELMDFTMDGFRSIPEISVLGTTKNKAAIISFNLVGAHHSDVGQILDQMGIAVRVGHHCTQPLLHKFNLTGTVRASFSIYNSLDEAKKLIDGLFKAKRMLL